MPFLKDPCSVSTSSTYSYYINITLILIKYFLCVWDHPGGQVRTVWQLVVPMKTEQRRECCDRGLETAEITGFGSPEMPVLVISRVAQSIFSTECLESPCGEGHSRYCSINKILSVDPGTFFKSSIPFHCYVPQFFQLLIFSLVGLQSLVAVYYFGSKTILFFPW